MHLPPPSLSQSSSAPTLPSLSPFLKTSPFLQPQDINPCTLIVRNHPGASSSSSIQGQGPPRRKTEEEGTNSNPPPLNIITYQQADGSWAFAILQTKAVQASPAPSDGRKAVTDYPLQALRHKSYPSSTSTKNPATFPANIQLGSMPHSFLQRRFKPDQIMLGWETESNTQPHQPPPSNPLTPAKGSQGQLGVGLNQSPPSGAALTSPASHSLPALSPTRSPAVSPTRELKIKVPAPHQKKKTVPNESQQGLHGNQKEPLPFSSIDTLLHPSSISFNDRMKMRSSLFDSVDILSQTTTRMPSLQLHYLAPLPFSDAAMEEERKRRCSKLPSLQFLADIGWDGNRALASSLSLKAAEAAAEDVQRAADELEVWTDKMRQKRRAQEGELLPQLRGGRGEFEGSPTHAASSHGSQRSHTQKGKARTMGGEMLTCIFPS